MDEIREREMTYLPGKTLQLLGFVDSEPLRTDQRYLFIKDPQVLLPEQDDASMRALSGLVQAMHENKKAAIVRYARTDKAHVALCALLPQLGSATEVDHCVMLNLPFEEDIRTYAFPPLAPREELLPTRQQSQAAQTLVQTLDLTASGEEALQPETTANPTLQRFYRALGRLALGQPEIPGKEEELPGPGSTDKLVQASLTYQPSSSAERSAMAAFKSAFVTHEVVKRTYHTDEGVRSSADVTSEAAGMRASSVCLSEEYPVEEFQKLVGCGRLEEGVAALAERVHSLVDRSVKDRSYAKALACCTAMRQACVSADRATICNDFLQQIKAKYKEDSSHSDFWIMLCASNLTLISLEESSSSFVSGREAEAFTDVVARKAPSLQQKLDQVIILDDLEDME
ncbi:hypothetical protein CEUSTIGMA_g8260.t1 [Chlamydomonas eustigma]|uniref:Ku domain-containing protein n=1 Tax=Chlamydomonas eustigma TaxID=1157962 RepID=A0A250XCK4_9CHLO|nr:hypothetical protein CEUSTIGMA_g8260.t1 [Chlamydomonas eustigma]|eukprot:GAX80825.1 hypothetical protein CEUSTIGMA_g8260.t1 [Chlamydomonas eustigma]